MNRAYVNVPAVDSFELHKNSTLGVGDSGFSGSRDESGLRSNDTRLSVFSDINGSGTGVRLGELM